MPSLYTQLMFRGENKRGGLIKPAAKQSRDTANDQENGPDEAPIEIEEEGAGDEAKDHAAG